MRVSRRIGLSIAAITALVATVVVAPAAAAAPVPEQVRSQSAGSSGFQYYLSLGDSLGFGYSEANLAKFTQDHEMADFAGYSQDLAGDLNLSSVTKNLSCPGETTITMITGPCPAAAAASGFGGWPYGQTAQLSAAQQALAQHAAARGLITVSIGSNDLLDAAQHCLTNLSCPQIGTALKTVGANLTTIVRTLHSAAPRATIVLLAPYNPYGHAQPVSNLAVIALDFTIAIVGLFNGARIADAFGPINVRYATTFDCGHLVYYCADRAPTEKDPFPGDIHPTGAGYGVIAEAFEKALG